MPLMTIPLMMSYQKQKIVYYSLVDFSSNLVRSERISFSNVSTSLYSDAKHSIDIVPNIIIIKSINPIVLFSILCNKNYCNSLVICIQYGDNNAAFSADTK